MAVGISTGVSVVLVAYHGEKWLPGCIRTLAESRSERLHLVLVDNGGHSGVNALALDEFDAEVLKTPHAMGFAEANNFALVQATRLGEFVLFLNQDTISPVGWLDRCVGVFDRDGSLGAVSPLIRDYEDRGWDPSFLACLSEEQRTSLEAPLGDTQDLLDVRNAPAPALLVRTDVLRRTGPFDPIFGSYYEDYDLCRRIRGIGYRIAFVPSARIRHYSGSTTTTRQHEMKRMRQIIRNRFIHQLRDSDDRRGRRIMRQFFLDLPHRLARGVRGTPTSQPPAVTLAAHADLLRIVPRLALRSYDQRAWMAYLNEIGWNGQIAGRVAGGSRVVD